MAGGDGDDVMIWNPGEGSDTMEGGAGNDTAVDNGGAGDEHFIVSAQGQRVTATRDNAAPFFLDIGTTETLDLNANARRRHRRGQRRPRRADQGRRQPRRRQRHDQGPATAPWT